MRNIKLVLEYDGSRYQGWQRLGKDESTNTISNKIIEVIKKMTNEDVELFCGARTEVGVHAYAQVVNFKTTTDMTLIGIEEMPERFHASLNAASKVYLYRMAINEVPSVFERKYVYHSFKKPDVELMKQAAILFIGKHDFKNFSTVKKNKSTEKEIYDIDIYDDGNEIQFTIHGNDFLHNMVRMILGTLIDVGLGNRKKEEIEAIFDPKSKIAASAPADPKGLFLQEVRYH